MHAVSGCIFTVQALVTNSLRLEPTMSRASVAPEARISSTRPCPPKPRTPSASGSFSGKTPLPFGDVATGAPMACANSWSTSYALARETPYPARMHGLLADARMRAAVAMAWRSTGSASVGR
jgi:hypothetical protein